MHAIAVPPSSHAHAPRSRRPHQLAAPPVEHPHTVTAPAAHKPQGRAARLARVHSYMENPAITARALPSTALPAVLTMSSSSLLLLSPSTEPFDAASPGASSSSSLPSPRGTRGGVSPFPSPSSAATRDLADIVTTPWPSLLNCAMTLSAVDRPAPPLPLPEALAGCLGIIDVRRYDAYTRGHMGGSSWFDAHDLVDHAAALPQPPRAHACTAACADAAGGDECDDGAGTTKPVLWRYMCVRTNAMCVAQARRRRGGAASGAARVCVTRWCSLATARRSTAPGPSSRAGGGALRAKSCCQTACQRAVSAGARAWRRERTEGSTHAPP